MVSILRIGGVPNSSTPETPDTLHFVGIRVSGVLESGTPAVLKIETIGSLGSAGVPEYQNHELYYSHFLFMGVF